MATPTSQRWLLLALGTAAFLVLLAATLPASLLLRWLPPAVQASGLAGSIWRGSAAQVVVDRVPLGGVAWRFRPGALLAGGLGYGVVLTRPDGEVRGEVVLRRAGRVELTDVRGAMAIGWIADRVAPPPGWTGTVELDVSRLELADGWPTAADGAIVLRGLRAPGRARLDIGSYELTLGAGQVGGPGVSGRLRDLAGPMRVRGTLALLPGRSYLLQGDVSAAPGADELITRRLAQLGPPDDAGRRTFGIEGSL